MKLLLLGSNGQVGWELRRALAPLGEIVIPRREEADLARPEQMKAMLRQVAPDVIINAAAYTAVDQAESAPEQARAINAEAPAVLAREANLLDAWLVHYSTDYVFDGNGECPWREDDATAPLNVYGQTKLEGEQAVRDSGCKHLLFRTSWVYAARGRNFIRTMLRLAAERDELQVIDDQYGAPTGAELIADVTAHALRSAAGQPEVGGLYHLSAAGEITWHGYARFVIEQARAAGWPVTVADQAIAKVPTTAFPTAATRPHNSRLDCRKLETTFGLQMPDWRDGVDRVVEELVTHGKE